MFFQMYKKSSEPNQEGDILYFMFAILIKFKLSTNAFFHIYNLIKNTTAKRLRNYITTKLQKIIKKKRCHKENGNTYQPCGHLTYKYKSKQN